MNGMAVYGVTRVGRLACYIYNEDTVMYLSESELDGCDCVIDRILTSTITVENRHPTDDYMRQAVSLFKNDMWVIDDEYELERCELHSGRVCLLVDTLSVPYRVYVGDPNEAYPLSCVSFVVQPREYKKPYYEWLSITDRVLEVRILYAEHSEPREHLEMRKRLWESFKSKYNVIDEYCDFPVNAPIMGILRKGNVDLDFTNPMNGIRFYREYGFNRLAQFREYPFCDHCLCYKTADGKGIIVTHTYMSEKALNKFLKENREFIETTLKGAKFTVHKRGESFYNPEGALMVVISLEDKR